MYNGIVWVHQTDRDCNETSNASQATCGTVWKIVRIISYFEAKSKFEAILNLFIINDFWNNFLISLKLRSYYSIW